MAKRDDVAVFIEGLLEKTNGPNEHKPKIFEVDDHLRKVKEKDYEPEIVSIGPIHHGKDHVKGMEQHKVRFLHQFLQEKAGLTVDKIVEELRRMEGEARRCYSESSLDLGSTDKFVEILLLDGCFVVQLIRRYSSNEERDKDDPIFGSENISQIRRDLMLFENQLPFFILRRLFEMIKTEDPEDNLCHSARFLVQEMFPWLDVSRRNSPSDTQLNPTHLLGLVYQCFSPFSTQTRCTAEKKKKKKKKKKTTLEVHINSASELKEIGGIRLRRSKDKRLTFASGILQIPQLQISCQTESLLRNVMAHEQLQLDDNTEKHVTDYVFFLHSLIRSNGDIRILRRSEIIINHLGGDDKILQMFDRLGTNFMRSSEFCYSDVFESLNRHYGRPHNKRMAKLRRKYFHSPWSLVKFLAATLLLLLTIVQTVFAVLSFTYARR